MSVEGDEESAGRPFGVGEQVLLVDERSRRYLVRLRSGASFQSHAGVIDHDAIIGSQEGLRLVTRRRDDSTARQRRVVVLRPTLSDVILKMPRGAQVIYPKDLGAILMAADLFPGARVLEAGVGSGALSITALRAGCIVTGYELREEFAETAKSNVASALGPDVAFDVQIRDVYDGVDERGLDRVLLDLAEPWRVIAHAARALRPGGILLAYLPTITQTADFRAGLENEAFALATTTEVLHRTWHIEGRSVRPDHRMVAHTGFLTTARRMLSRAEGSATPGTEENTPA